MKKIILITVFFSFISCGKSTYYAFDDVADKDYPSYCTLEITRKKEIIYRASSYKYSSQSYPFSNLYIYIYSDKKASDIDDESFRFTCNVSDLFFIKNEFKPKYEQRIINFSGEYMPYLAYYKKGSDTITLIRNTDETSEYIRDENGFKENGIRWFPPYMVKVDKIDYTKFKKSVQHMNLKDPRKEK